MTDYATIRERCMRDLIRDPREETCPRCGSTDIKTIRDGAICGCRSCHWTWRAPAEAAEKEES